MLRVAQAKGAVRCLITNLREFATDRRRSVDDRPYGGGPGMVLKADVVTRAVRAVRQMEASQPGRLILLSPQGRRFTQEMAQQLSREPRLLLVAGHYEGIDERVREILQPEEISLGDFILSGGELPALCLIDAVVRLLPGVLGSPESLRCESFTLGLLEYPQYTRPAQFEGHAVPEVLLSGHHRQIEAWRQEQARRRTLARRPDLLGGMGRAEEVHPNHKEQAP